MRSVLTLVVVSVAVAQDAPPAPAQPVAPWTQPADSSPATQPSELPPALMHELRQIEDFTPDFDSPAFYSLVRRLRFSEPPLPPGHAVLPQALDDWTPLIERPADFRGLPITVQGVIGRNKAWNVTNRGDLGGPIWQLELSQPSSPISMTVICLNEGGDLPIGATVKVTGYFVKARQFPISRPPGSGYAGLIVAYGPTATETTAPVVSEKGERKWGGDLTFAAIAAGLLVAFILMRRSAGARRSTGDIRSLHARRSAPVDLSDDLDDWARDEGLPDASELPDERDDERS